MTLFKVGEVVRFRRETATAWMPVDRTFAIERIEDWEFPKLSVHPQKVFLDATCDFRFVSGHLLEKFDGPTPTR